MLAAHMPELVPVHERLVELAGGGDVEARLLSLYNPPAFITGCSQAAWPGDEPALIRNYDYPEALLEGLLLCSAWQGRRVIGMSDCLWGLLDGINEAGLAASLTFGGRRAKGDGFAIPLVLRYVLEVCDDVGQACAVLARVPVHTAQNVTLLDRSGAYVTVHLGPDMAPEFRRTAVTTNHQGRVEWPEYERAVRSLDREHRLEQLVADPGMSADRLLEAFLQPPLHSAAHEAGAGTLYTAAYYVAAGRMELRWPGTGVAESFADFREGDFPVALDRSLLAA